LEALALHAFASPFVARWDLERVIFFWISDMHG